MLKAAQFNLNISKEFIYGKRLVIAYPEMPARISGPGWTGGVFSLYQPWQYAALVATRIRHNLIASMQFQSFTNNCGIRAITGNSLYKDENLFGKLWFDLFEAYAYVAGYSILVGSTGMQNGTNQLRLIEKYGIDWQIVKPGINRRVGIEDILSLYWKNLKKPTISINWENPIADAQQLTDS